MSFLQVISLENIFIPHDIHPLANRPKKKKQSLSLQSNEYLSYVICGHVINIHLFFFRIITNGSKSRVSFRDF